MDTKEKRGQAQSGAPPPYRSLRTKVLRYFLLLSMLPAIVMGIVTYIVSIGVISGMVDDSIKNSIDTVSAETDKLLLSCVSVAEMVANDPSFQHIVREPLPDDIAKRYSEDITLDSRLNFIHQYSSSILGIYIISENGGVYKSNYMTPYSSDLRREPWYQKVLSEGGTWFEPHLNSFVVQYIEKGLISYGLPFVDRVTGQRIGIVIVDVDVDEMRNIYDTQLIRGGRVALIGQNDQIVLYPSKVEDKASFDAMLQSVDLSKDYLKVTNRFGDQIIYKTSEVSSWKTLGIVPHALVQSDGVIITLVFAILMACIFVFSIALAIKLSNNITKPIMLMRNTMKTVEKGDMAVRLPVAANDEIGQLSQGFNHMLEEVELLLQNEITHQEELRRYELKTLQAQINPHFLYNTLDSISWLARDHDTDSVVTMIDALTKFFRIGISRGKDMITINEELTHLKSYLMIQSLRYESMLEYVIDVPGKLGEYLIPKLTFQPLVENALYHGIKEKNQKGTIFVTGKDVGRFMEFLIEDTGLGMTPNRLGELSRALTRDDVGDIDSYGVLNVQRRIRLNFGEDYGLKYESVYGVGTSVLVRLPKQKGR